MDILVIRSDGLSEEDRRELLLEVKGHVLVDDVVACTPEQASLVRRALDW